MRRLLLRHKPTSKELDIAKADRSEPPIFAWRYYFHSGKGVSPSEDCIHAIKVELGLHFLERVGDSLVRLVESKTLQQLKYFLPMWVGWERLQEAYVQVVHVSLANVLVDSFLLLIWV